MASKCNNAQLSSNSKDSEGSFSLENLPSEVLSSICDHLCESRDLDISVTKRCPLTMPILRYQFSDIFTELRPLLTTSRWTRGVVEAWISRNVRFYADSSYFEYIPAAFGRQNCSLVHSLRLELAENTASEAEESWPKLFDSIIRNLPNLTQIIIWTCKESGRTVSLSSRPKVARRPASDDDIRIAVWKFAAFLALRHPTLRRMTVCKHPVDQDTTIADSIVRRIVLDDGTLRSDFLAKSLKDKVAFESANVKQCQDMDDLLGIRTPEYEILDAALIRRTKWDAIANSPASHFMISRHAFASSTDDLIGHPQEIYRTYVDQRSFITKDHRTQEGWLRHTNDELIDLCDTYVSRLNLSEEQYLQCFLEDVESNTTVRLNLERQLKEARDDLGTMADDLSNLQRRYDWAVSERNTAVNALQVQTSSIQEDRLAMQYSGLSRLGLDEWYRGTRARQW